MPRSIPALALLVCAVLLTACTTHSPNLVSEPLRPASNGPTAYLIGSIGPDAQNGLYVNQRILLRERGSPYGAAAWWTRTDASETPQDIQDGAGAASVFILPLKPGNYEFYDFQFFSTSYGPYGSTARSTQAREQFLVPLRLEAGKAYYIGEFRSRCLPGSGCLFINRNQQQRDEPIARRYTPALPPLEYLQLDLKRAYPFILPGDISQVPAPLDRKESQQ